MFQHLCGSVLCEFFPTTIKVSKNKKPIRFLETMILTMIVIMIYPREGEREGESVFEWKISLWSTSQCRIQACFDTVWMVLEKSLKIVFPTFFLVYFTKKLKKLQKLESFHEIQICFPKGIDYQSPPKECFGFRWTTHLLTLLRKRYAQKTSGWDT